MARILIAEDEPGIRELIAFTVRFAGHEVTAVGDGEAALVVACESVPDLLVLDTSLPKIKGYAVCRALKMSEILKDIPVVFLSAQGQTAEVQEGMEAGAEAYMLKPFAPDQLVERINSILAKVGKGTDTEPDRIVQKEDFDHLMKVFWDREPWQREAYERSERVRPSEVQRWQSPWKRGLKAFFSALVHLNRR